MDNLLQKRVAQFKRALAEANIRCSREKAINYGHQLHCASGSDEATVNIYHGKKGFSVVVQGKESPFKHTVEALAQGAPAPKEQAVSNAAMDGL